MTYIQKTAREIEKFISDLLPKLFGIIFDGWSEGTTHYICVFAVFLDKDSKERQVLLGINPPYDEEHFDADSHVAYITDLLQISYGKAVGDIAFAVGDNAPVSKSIADKLGVPLVGCASHRWNLEVIRWLGPHEDLLVFINNLMKLSTFLIIGTIQS